MLNTQKEMTKKIFFIVVFAGISLLLSAQTALPKKVSAKLPSIFKRTEVLKLSELRKEFCNGSSWGQKKTSEEFWVVYSDRDDNTTYKDADGREKYNTLGFGERVVVAQIKGDMALVYGDERLEGFPNVPDYAKNKGWVKLENLLLWTNCPGDSRGVLLKALIAINLNKQEQNKSADMYLYTNPEIRNNGQKLNMNMSFYYVMKDSRDGKYALLCKQSSFSGSNLYGWVSTKSYAAWNQRTCLEPNWDPSYVENHRNQKALIYMKPAMTEGDVVTHWQYGIPNGDMDQFSQYRMKPNALRFPILDKPEGNAVYCTSFADKTGNSNEAGVVADNINSVATTQMHAMRQMNIILAIEATTDMASYLPAVKSSLATFKDNAASGLTIKVALVLYRTAELGAQGIEVLPLTNADDPRLLSMLTQQKANGKWTGKERNVALAQAIEAATDASKIGFKENNSNLLLIIGNRGMADGDNSLTEARIQKRLSDSKMQVMSIQVMRNESGSCARYTDQVNEMIINNVSEQYKSIGAVSNFKPTKNLDGYTFSSSRENVLYASIRFGKMGQGLQADAIKKYVSNGVANFANSVKRKEDTAEKALNDINFYPEFIKGTFGAKFYEGWKDLQAISAYSGYAKLKGLDNSEYWHYIIYLSDQELEDLVKKLENTYNAAKNANSNDRTPYVNAMRALIKAQLPDKSEKEVQEMSAEDMQEAIYGLNVPTKSMNMRYSLKDMANSSVVSDEEYLDVMDHFAEKYLELKNLQGTYRYRLEVDNVHYYWIPIEDLP